MGVTRSSKEIESMKSSQEEQYETGTGAFRRGWHDFAKKRNSCPCPYAEGSKEATEWSHGYDSAWLEHEHSYGSDY